MADEAPIIGVDATRGGGPSADMLPLPAGESRELLLVRASDNYAGGEGFRGVFFDVWGFDPRLDVAVSLQRSRNANVDTPFNSSNVTATVVAQLLARTAKDVAVGATLPAASLFAHGGALDTVEVEGCEITSAVQGIRFYLIAQRTGSTNYDITATVQARPNVALGCRALALALLQGVTVSQPASVGW